MGKWDCREGVAIERVWLWGGGTVGRVWLWGGGTVVMIAVAN